MWSGTADLRCGLTAHGWQTEARYSTRKQVMGINEAYMTASPAALSAFPFTGPPETTYHGGTEEDYREHPAPAKEQN